MNAAHDARGAIARENDRMWTARIVAIALGGIAVQAGAADRGFYFGASGGRADYDIEGPPLFAVATSSTPVPIFQPPPAFVPIVNPFIPAEIRVDGEDHDTTWSGLAGYVGERTATGKADIDTVSLGVLYRL
jgi:hypothetical protein